MHIRLQCSDVPSAGWRQPGRAQLAGGVAWGWCSFFVCIYRKYLGKYTLSYVNIRKQITVIQSNNRKMQIVRANNRVNAITVWLITV